MRTRKPGSHSVKSWARHLARVGRAPMNIINPERYLHSKQRVSTVA